MNAVDWVKANQKQAALGVGGVLAVVLGLRTAQARKANAAPPEGYSADGTPLPQGAAIGGWNAGTLNTTGEDVYNALQPQMAQTQNMLSELLDRLRGGGTTTTPTTPTPPSNSGRTPAGAWGTPPVPRTPIRRAPQALPPVRRPPKAPTTKPGKPIRRHTVAKNENLTSIGKRYGVSWVSIYNANKSVIGTNPDRIKPGQVLTIP